MAAGTTNDLQDFTKPLLPSTINVVYKSTELHAFAVTSISLAVFAIANARQHLRFIVVCREHRDGGTAIRLPIRRPGVQSIAC